jgi:hypothetical protein
MPIVSNAPGRAGVGPLQTGAFGLVLSDGSAAYKVGGGVINGSKSRDPNNTPDVRVLRSGTIMARNATTNRYGVWAIGTFQAATTASATTFTLTAAEAVELVRRIGASGSLTVVGSATAGGALVTEVVTYSAVNISTGAVTVTAMTSAFVAGSVVTEASFTVPTSMIVETTGILIPETGDRDWQVPIGGQVIAANLLPWPASANTTLRNHIRTSLSTLPGGKFVFDDVI